MKTPALFRAQNNTNNNRKKIQLSNVLQVIHKRGIIQAGAVAAGGGRPEI